MFGHTQSPVQWVPGLLPLHKAARLWRWSPTPIWCQGCEWVELYPLAPCAHAWHV